MSDPVQPYQPLESRVAKWCRPVLVYIVSLILLIHYGLLSLAEAIWRVTYTHLTATELAIIVAPVIYYIFQRTKEKQQGIAS